MAPLIVLLGSLAVLRSLGFAGVAPLDNWDLPLRTSLALMFLLTASAHWGKGRPDLIRMVPRVFPAPAVIVTITGILELLGAMGLLIPSTARAAAICLFLLLIVMFPANLRAARQRQTIMGRPVMGVAARGLVQAIFLAALAAVALGWR